MTPKTLSILSLALLAGCQSWHHTTTQAPSDTNTTPLAETAPNPIPPTTPDNIPNPTPRGTDTTTAADAKTPDTKTTDTKTTETKTTVATAQPTTPAPTNPDTAAPTPTQQDAASVRAQALKTQDRPAGQTHPYNPMAATGPIAPATAPYPTLRDLPIPARLHVAADADVATRVRNWPLSVNAVPSGHSIGGPVYRIIVPPPRSNATSDVVAEDLFQTVVTAPQMIITPFWMLVTHPGQTVEYHGEQFPPSYTVNDPLPYYTTEKVPGIIQMTREKQP